MVEFLRVSFDDTRKVIANDVSVGDTNTLLRLPPNVYTIALAGPADYDPPSVDVVLGGTSQANPERVTFKRTPRPAAPPAAGPSD